jgi:geranylgeranyl reductase family protein
MKEYDIGIIGAGPIGGFISGMIAEKNYNVAVFEKHKKIGRPLNCAGLITPRVFNLLEISKSSIIQNEIKGANIHSSANHILRIESKKIQALAINRTNFDQDIIKNSEKKGAKIFLDSKILSAQKINDKIEIRTSKNEDIKCKILIGADGPHSLTRDRFDFPKPYEFLRAIGAEVTNVNLNSDFVDIFVGTKIAPGFFAWIIPTNKDGTNARIGLCISKIAKHPPNYYFENFLKNKNVITILKDFEIIGAIGGIIPLGYLKKTYTDNILIAGDAAAQVKPTSGGGIYTGLLCANHCANVAIEALLRNDFSSQILKKYQKLWQADIGKELLYGMRFRKMFNNLSDKHFDKYIEKFTNPKITDIILKYGDIDYPSKLVKPLLKKAPSLLRLAPKVINK